MTTETTTTYTETACPICMGPGMDGDYCAACQVRRAAPAAYFTADPLGTARAVAGERVNRAAAAAYVVHKRGEFGSVVRAVFAGGPLSARVFADLSNAGEGYGPLAWRSVGAYGGFYSYGRRPGEAADSWVIEPFALG